MSMDDRKKKILKAVVESYVESAEPIGSKSLVDILGGNVSSATVRNEMAELEALGYLEQPHVSAGRIPSDKGYRLYVNELMPRHRLSVMEMKSIDGFLTEKVHEFSELIEESGRMLSEITKYTAYAVTPASEELTIFRFELLKLGENTILLILVTDTGLVKNRMIRSFGVLSDEQLIRMSEVLNRNLTGVRAEDIDQMRLGQVESTDGMLHDLMPQIWKFVCDTMNQNDGRRMFLDGEAMLLAHPEFRDIDKAHKLLKYLTRNQNDFKTSSALPDRGQPIRITIGDENPAPELFDSSTVSATYTIGGNTGTIGLIGPTRMDYGRAEASLTYFVKRLGELLKDGDADGGK